MPGVKGRSGGARSGAGRPPKEQVEKVTIVTRGSETPLEFLLSVMNDNGLEDKLRLEAAKTAAQYVHPKKGESSGKKEAAEDALKSAGAGKYGARAGPRLVTSR